MKQTIFLILALLAATFASAQSADSTATAEKTAPQSVDERWDAANTAYVNGDFHKAEMLYTELLAEGLSSTRLYYNLGNACFKEGNTGRAILCYHRALKLDPSNEDARYNLSVAEARTKDTIETIPELFLTEWMRGVRRMMGCTAWSIMSIVMLVAALSLSLVYLLSQQLAWRKGGFYGMLATLLLFALSTAMAAGQRGEMIDTSRAVVMSGSAAVKSSPDKASTDLFVLHEGTLVTISDTLGEWAEVTIADGKRGWLESKTIEVI